MDTTSPSSGSAAADESRGGNSPRPPELRLDAHAVKVLAHPLRSRLFGWLRMHGPATATTLAFDLQTNTGATSYHLRALESVGLVEDTQSGVGRQRVWRAATQSHGWSNSAFADDEDARASLGWLRRDYIRQFAARAEDWLDAEDTWPAEWSDALGMSDTIISVTPQQLGRLRHDIAELLRPFHSAEETVEDTHVPAGEDASDAVEKIHFVVQSMPVTPRRQQ